MNKETLGEALFWDLKELGLDPYDENILEALLRAYWAGYSDGKVEPYDL